MTTATTFSNRKQTKNPFLSRKSLIGLKKELQARQRLFLVGSIYECEGYTLNIQYFYQRKITWCQKIQLVVSTVTEETLIRSTGPKI